MHAWNCAVLAAVSLRGFISRRRVSWQGCCKEGQALVTTVIDICYHVYRLRSVAALSQRGLRSGMTVVSLCGTLPQVGYSRLLPSTWVAMRIALDRARYMQNPLGHRHNRSSVGLYGSMLRNEQVSGTCTYQPVAHACFVFMVSSEPGQHVFEGENCSRA
ncbi:unnamed protein product [Ectocarpus sp. 4 AP-2014]